MLNALVSLTVSWIESDLECQGKFFVLDLALPEIVRRFIVTQRRITVNDACLVDLCYWTGHANFDI